MTSKELICRECGEPIKDFLEVFRHNLGKCSRDAIIESMEIQDLLIQDSLKEEGKG